jgi:hypothetical protein
VPLWIKSILLVLFAGLKTLKKRTVFIRNVQNVRAFYDESIKKALPSPTPKNPEKKGYNLG